ncbi:hypothetical protein SSX86_030184 [Deinandra increscens subsp. villosa]|uniref:Uncharacterized protein n=1 Tax=Deinandra increscens subsp. villosa TaxID=3103831 RepID=A0AAP0C663_9ASTR
MDNGSAKKKHGSNHLLCGGSAMGMYEPIPVELFQKHGATGGCIRPQETGLETEGRTDSLTGICSSINRGWKVGGGNRKQAQVQRHGGGVKVRKPTQLGEEKVRRVVIRDRPALFPIHCLNRSLMGELKYLEAAENVRDMLIKVRHPTAAISYVCGVRLIITFKQNKDARDEVGESDHQIASDEEEKDDEENWDDEGIMSLPIIRRVCTFKLVLKNAALLLDDKDPMKLETEAMLTDQERAGFARLLVNAKADKEIPDVVNIKYPDFGKTPDNSGDQTKAHLDVDVSGGSMEVDNDGFQTVGKKNKVAKGKTVNDQGAGTSRVSVFKRLQDPAKSQGAASRVGSHNSGQLKGMLLLGLFRV